MQSIQFSVFVTLLTTAALGLAFYVQRRTASAFRLSPRARTILGVALAACILALPLGRLARGLFPASAARGLSSVGFLLTLSLLISAVCLAIADLLLLVVRLGRKALQRTSAARTGELADASTGEAAELPRELPEVTAPDAGASPVASTPATTPASAEPVLKAPVTVGDAPSPGVMPRRDFLSQGAVGAALLAGGGTSFYGAFFGRYDYVTEEVAVPIPGLPRSLDGFSILQLSDIHFGLYIGEREIAVAEELVRKARGDLVVLTGDLVDHDPAYADLLGHLARRLGPLTRGGVTAIPGNHDHFTGLDRVIDALERGGASVLRNRGQVIGDRGGSFALLGVDDVWARRRVPGGGPDLARALADVPPDLARILLCHNPVFFPEAAGEIALQLSGHTHGGQVNPLVHPGSWVLPYGYVEGLYQRGASRLYVNRGFGVAGPPARVAAPPELTRIVLVSA
ncbi:metallophosphoesterase [Chondromyces crocatus]|uniref:Calcineurin-like phosphoesterase domain-containing protein n=1 Tax=Chondromyces crocatus TaxID=52 RepID=A0A0K1EAK5_CHOCO|nr:metallophosphoesterase [Chondromyces crocatus]AKT37916.1 uncharacterized protein CMC5_020590 [Chondromyces crocatus]